ncbi:MAG: TetR/AcrR family transcriptional regulator [Myxococcota bacterium]
MDERSERIVETAITLAEQGGYEAVRLRDVANHARVALGTLYKRFRSKEDMLVAAIDLEIGRMEERMILATPPGAGPVERVTALFEMITGIMMRRPKLSRAVIRAAASGEPTIADKVLRYQSRTIDLITEAIVDADDARPVSPERARVIADLLQQIWFASLVGWMGGLRDAARICQNVHQAAKLMIVGVEVSQD